MDERLQRFRACIARLDPGAQPSRAIAEQLYVEPAPRGLSSRLSLALKLAPASKHLVVGGIGTGKSTEVLVAALKLREVGDTLAIYVDVSERHDLSKNLKGVLVALAGLYLSELTSSSTSAVVGAARERFKRIAHGFSEFVEEIDKVAMITRSLIERANKGQLVRRSGVLYPPPADLTVESRERVDALRTLKGALDPELKNVVLIFDSLDRVADLKNFREAIAEDVHALSAAGIGVIVVGSSRLLFGADRSIVDLFDSWHPHSALDVERDPAAREFMEGVLARRADEQTLPADSRRALVLASGGAMRDLLKLARLALEETFLTDDDHVGEKHIAHAIDVIGRGLIFGLSETEAEMLLRMGRDVSFVPTTDEDLALIESRRILEYSGGVRRYAVHPCLKKFLEKLAGK